jgi:hypothetical protein
MNSQEREVIDGIFDRLKQVESQPRDPEAEQYIGGRVTQQPYAPYAMAQALYVQEQALKQYAERVRQLEEDARAAQPAANASFLGGLFGGGAAPQPAPSREAFAAAPPPAYQPAPPPQGPWGATAAPASGGFLRTAMTTAAGVAGGALLFEGIRGLFSGGMGGGLGGLGGQPAVNETVINEYSSPEHGITDASYDSDMANDLGLSNIDDQDGGDFTDDDRDDSGGNWA